jgi:hypothetical protein
MWPLRSRVQKKLIRRYAPSPESSRNIALARPHRVGGPNELLIESREDTALEFSRTGRPIGIEGMTGYMSEAEFADGHVWVPSRRDPDSSPLAHSCAISHTRCEQMS